jgi:hypothetical protein
MTSPSLMRPSLGNVKIVHIDCGLKVTHGICAFSKEDDFLIMLSVLYTLA